MNSLIFLFRVGTMVLSEAFLYVFGTIFMVINQVFRRNLYDILILLFINSDVSTTSFCGTVYSKTERSRYAALMLNRRLF